MVSFCAVARTPIVLLVLVVLMLSMNEDENKIVTLDDLNLWVRDCVDEMVIENDIKVIENKLKDKAKGR